MPNVNSLNTLLKNYCEIHSEWNVFVVMVIYEYLKFNFLILLPHLSLPLYALRWLWNFFQIFSFTMRNKQHIKMIENDTILRPMSMSRRLSIIFFSFRLFTHICIVITMSEWLSNTVAWNKCGKNAIKKTIEIKKLWLVSSSTAGLSDVISDSLYMQFFNKALHFMHFKPLTLTRIINFHCYFSLSYFVFKFNLFFRWWLCRNDKCEILWRVIIT